MPVWIDDRWALANLRSCCFEAHHKFIQLRLELVDDVRLLSDHKGARECCGVGEFIEVDWASDIGSRDPADNLLKLLARLDVLVLVQQLLGTCSEDSSEEFIGWRSKVAFGVETYAHDFFRETKKTHSRAS